MRNLSEKEISMIYSGLWILHDKGHVSTEEKLEIEKLAQDFMTRYSEIKESKKVYVVVDDSLQHGVEASVYKNKHEAKKKFDDIVKSYKDNLKELGNGEINEYYAEITDKWDDEVARVFWQTKIVE